MKKTRISGITFVAIVSLAALLFCGIAIAQSVQVQGVIDGRSGATMTVRVRRRQCGRPAYRQHAGTRSRRRTPYAQEADGMTALVPGLPVQVKGPTTPRTS